MTAMMATTRMAYSKFCTFVKEELLEDEMELLAVLTAVLTADVTAP